MPKDEIWAENKRKSWHSIQPEDLDADREKIT